MHSWHGPYRLVHKLTPVTFELRTQTNKLLKAPVHVNRMKPFVDPTDRPVGEPELPHDDQDVHVFLDLQENEIPDDSFEPPKLSAPPPCSPLPNQAPNPPSSATAPPPSNNDDPIYDIEHILKYRTRKGEKQCLVKSKGFASKHNSWIPVDSLIEKPDSKTPPSSPPPSPSPGPSHQTNAISFVRPPRLFSSLVLNPLPYFLLMISLFTISHAFFPTPQLGPLYDCSHIKHNAIFRLPQTPNCSHSLYDTNHSVQYFYADVRQPFTQRTPITLFHCIADIREYRCHENFFGSKFKHFSVKPIKVTKADCLHAFSKHLSPYGPLFPTSSNQWSTRSHDSYSCSWLKTKVNRYPHFRFLQYQGELVGDDQLIHQDITHSTCFYRNQSCVPKELPNTILAWTSVKHSFNTFRFIGRYLIHRISDFVLIPKLSFGGSITNDQGLFLQLDNGFLLTRQRSTSHAYSHFLHTAKTYLQNAKPSLQTGILSAHITSILEMQKRNMTHSWEKLCEQQTHLLKIQHWPILNFPETGAQWFTTSNDETVELIGDAILLSKCQVVPHYLIYWNRTYNNKCFREFPVLIFPSRTIQYLQILNRHLIPQGSTISCNQRPLFTYIQDQVGTLWHLSQNGTISPHTSKLLYSHVSPLRFHFAKIRGLNSHLVYPKQHQLDRSSLLDLVSANHQSLQDINAIATSGQGNFLTGLGKLIGITVHSLSNGGSTIIHALGHGIKDGFSGLGTFNHAVVTSLGNASGTILRSTGHALKDTSEGAGSLFHSIIGGLGGSFLWTILTILILFFVYRKFFCRQTIPFS